MKHSYVLELKYLPGRATEAEVSTAREKAVEQLTRYADAVAIERSYKPTRSTASSCSGGAGS